MSVKVKGLAKALRDIDRKSESIQNAVIEVLADTASAIDFDAKTNAPYELGGQVLGVKGKIRAVPISKFNYKVEIRDPQDFDAYAEFGTGQNASQILNGPGYTVEMRAIAREFYKNGQGTLIGQPFLFPAWIKHTANILEELRIELNKASKK